MLPTHGSRSLEHPMAPVSTATVPARQSRLKNAAKNLLAMAFGVALAFVIAEIGLSFFFPPPP